MRKERPILFSTPMIIALLEGRKQMTRRILKLKHLDVKDIASIHSDGSGLGWIAWQPHAVSAEETKRLYPGNEGFKCPHGSVGDILWVRETFVKACLSEDGDGPIEGENWKYWYLADDEWANHDWHHPHKEGPQAGPRWKPSIYMPKAASRIWLEITNIRVERLQDIEGDIASESEALKEGIMEFHHGDGVYGYHWKGDMDGGNFVHPEDAFKDLWQSINGESSWGENPWVWVIEFKVLSTTGKPKEINNTEAATS